MIKPLLQQFINFVRQQPNMELYNEAGLQHELALFLRSKLDVIYRVQLERNIDGITNAPETFSKKEMDIYIENMTNLGERYCIELKVSYGRSVASRTIKIHEDIYFLEQLKKVNFKECYFLFATPCDKFMRSKPGRLKMYDTFSSWGITIDHLHNSHVSDSYKNKNGNYVYEYDKVFVKQYRSPWQDLKNQINRNSVKEDWKCVLLEI